jgi:hypothetical protein
MTIQFSEPCPSGASSPAVCVDAGDELLFYPDPVPDPPCLNATFGPLGTGGPTPVPQAQRRPLRTGTVANSNADAGLIGERTRRGVRAP